MIELTIPGRTHDLGGLQVARVLPFAQRRMVGPFIFFDHIGPVSPPQGLPRHTDVRPHPHIGLSTLTYLYAGQIMHRDSEGHRQAIRPGEVNWMIAGRGISHSERFEGMREPGGELHGIQAWIALPDSDEETAPGFSHLEAGQLPQQSLPGGQLRVIAGRAYGLESPVQTFSPLFYVHAELRAGAVLEMCGGYSERALFVARGAVTVDGQRFEVGQMAVFSTHGEPAIRAEADSTLMLLGGDAIGPRHIWWNFVSSRRERIEQAKDDWRAGRFTLPVDDAEEFIPLPEG